MKLETELKPGDIVLLKVLACILILFFTLRFLVFPGLEKNQDLQNEKEQVEQTKQEMQDTIKQKSIVEKKIVKQKAELVNASQGFYDLLENQQVDELVTGIALKHNLNRRNRSRSTGSLSDCHTDRRVRCPDGKICTGGAG